MAIFKSWVKPGTSDVRVYISGLPGQSSAKVYAIARPSKEFLFQYDMRVQIPEGVYTRKDELLDRAEQAIDEAAGFRITTFEEILELKC